MYISLTSIIQPDGKSFGRWLWDCAQAGPQANILTDIVAFYVGCVAGVNNWGDKILELSNSFRIKLYGYVSFGLTSVMTIYALWVFFRFHFAETGTFSRFAAEAAWSLPYTLSCGRSIQERLLGND